MIIWLLIYLLLLYLLNLPVFLRVIEQKFYFFSVIIVLCINLFGIVLAWNVIYQEYQNRSQGNNGKYRILYGCLIYLAPPTQKYPSF